MIKPKRIFLSFYYIFFISAFLILLKLPLHSVSPLGLSNNKGSYSLQGHLEVLEDKSGKWTLKDIQSDEKSGMFQPIKGFPNYGYTKSNIWIRFQLNTDKVDWKDWYLEIKNPTLEYIDFYIPKIRAGYLYRKAGTVFPFYQRDIDHNNFIFKNDIKFDRLKYLYIKIHTSAPALVPLYVWERDSLNSYRQNGHYLHGGFLGIFIIIIAFSLFLFMMIREFEFLAFLLYVFSYFFMQKTVFGFGFQYLWQDSPDWQRLSYAVSINFISLSMVLFSKSFFKINRYSGKVYYFTLGLILYFLLSLVLSLVPKYSSITNMLCNFSGLIALLLIFSYSIRQLRKGYPGAAYFITGFFLFLLGSFANGLMAGGIFPYNFFTENSMRIGATFKISFLAIALADRINLFKEEKLKAQDDTIRIQKEAKENLERKVEERTEELANANEKLKELDRAKSEFFANISHEFRTPLTLILSPLESIIQGNFGDSIMANETLFQSMHQNGNRLIKLINNLLDFTRLEAGKTILQKRNIDIPTLLEFYTASIESQAKLKGLAIEFQNNNHGLTANIDGDLFEKAFFNLVSNAFKFTLSGGNVEIVLDEGKDDTFVVSVKDTGIGIPPDKQEFIFERFGQLDTSASRKFEGTGIGLALTREIVELSGGNITVQSEPGKGSRFTITLPVDDFSSDEKIDKPDHIKSYLLSEFQVGNVVQPVIPGDQPVKSRGSTVLVVEDSADMSAYLVGLLSESYNVITAPNGKEGLEKALSDMPDLILADVMMPEMDGYDMTKRIGMDDKLKGIPVILLTAKADMEMKIEGIELGAIDYITKPFNPRELLARIGSQLELKKLSDELERANEHLQNTLNDSSILVSDVGHRFYNEMWSISQLTSVVRELLDEITASNLKLDEEVIDFAGSTLEKSEESFARIEAMKQKIKDNFGKVVEKESLDILEIITEAEKIFAEKFKENRILFEKEIDLEEKTLIFANRDQLLILFDNLLNNAIQALIPLERENKKIILKVNKSAEGILLIFEDNGPGISDNIQENIFKMFFSTKAGNTQGGLGMGLSIVRWIVEDCHKGKISVQSKVGECTKFAVWLPLV